MNYKVILVETNKQLSDTLAATLKKAPGFELLSTFDNANAALGQSHVYNPNLFFIDIDNAELLQRKKEKPYLKT